MLQINPRKICHGYIGSRDGSSERWVPARNNESSLFAIFSPENRSPDIHQDKFYFPVERKR